MNQDSQLVGYYGKVESDSQYRGLRYWIENKGSRTSNLHFFRKVRRPDGSLGSLGYGKDSLVDCLERIFRHKVLGTPVREMAGTYPDAASQRWPTIVVHAARAVLQRNWEHIEASAPAVATASLAADSIILHDPLRGENVELL